MKIAKIIVDKLPESASRCPVSVNNWNPLTRVDEVDCRFTTVRVYMSVREFVTQRCPGCPLVEEAEGVQE